jgi:hypothetical protein
MCEVLNFGSALELEYSQFSLEPEITAYAFILTADDDFSCFFTQFDIS